MNGHLSPQRIAACSAGERNAEELRHLEECEACAAEKASLEAALANFRSAVRDWSARQSAAETANAWAPQHRSVALRPIWLAAVAGLALMIAIPAWRAVEQSRRAAQIEADERLSSEVRAHLMREVPQPLEPLTKLVVWGPSPQGEDPMQSTGGTQ
jgi:hypothetical protein